MSQMDFFDKANALAVDLIEALPEDSPRDSVKLTLNVYNMVEEKK